MNTYITQPQHTAHRHEHRKIIITQKHIAHRQVCLITDLQHTATTWMHHYLQHIDMNTYTRNNHHSKNAAHSTQHIALYMNTCITERQHTTQRHAHLSQHATRLQIWKHHHSLKHTAHRHDHTQHNSQIWRHSSTQHFVLNWANCHWSWNENTACVSIHQLGTNSNSSLVFFFLLDTDQSYSVVAKDDFLVVEQELQFLHVVLAGHLESRSVQQGADVDRSRETEKTEAKRYRYLPLNSKK